jgi:hypothetical protein
METPMFRVRRHLSEWRGSKVELVIEWIPGGPRLVSMVGALGEANVREDEPDEVGDQYVVAFVPVGDDGFVLGLDSNGLVEVDSSQPGVLTLQVQDDVRVVLSRVDGG